jgi:hypothetical protein
MLSRTIFLRRFSGSGQVTYFLTTTIMSNPSPMSIIKKLGLPWNSYILVYIRNCGVLDFSEFDEKWHGKRYSDITNGGLNP